MIVSIRDVLHGADLSGSVERDSTFSVEATFGSRMDVLNMTLHDPDRTLALPDRREIVIYDAQSIADGGSGIVVDPPWAVSPYNIYRTGSRPAARVSTDPTQWTPRLFAGYLATPEYSLISTERKIAVSAQDYTYRLRSTVANRAFNAHFTDAAIVKAVFKAYRPDFNTDNVVSTFTDMPLISFPVHSLEQFMQRITKITRAIYRVDYFKRLWYGPIGQFPAPFNLAESGDDLTLTPANRGYEQGVYSPDAASLSDRVWIVGRDFQSKTQTYIIPAALVDGTHFQFVLPGSATKFDIDSVSVNHGSGYVSKTFGESPNDGDITDQSTFRYQVIFQPTPPTVAFKVTPSAGDLLKIVGKFRYPLIQIYTDPTLVADAGGLFFDAVVRDKRIRDLTLAQKVGKAYLQTQGIALKGFTCITLHRFDPDDPAVVIGPAQTIQIDAPLTFAGLGENPKTFIITRTTTTLDADSDLQHPYRVELEMAGHAVMGGY